MPETILITGTIFASSVGCGLLALLLRATVRSARWPAKGQLIGNHQPDNKQGATETSCQAGKFRGYDTPELYRDDLIARSGDTEDGQLLH